jgi:hypothetical protein
MVDRLLGSDTAAAIGPSSERASVISGCDPFVSDVRAVSESERDGAEWMVSPMEWRKIACSLLKRGLTETEKRQYVGSKQSSQDPCSENEGGGNASKSWLHRWIDGL